jgi:hypothetical protein
VLQRIRPSGLDRCPKDAGARERNLGSYERFFITLLALEDEQLAGLVLRPVAE